MAEGEGFEPPLGLLLSLISSQVPSTTQPPFPPFAASGGNYGTIEIRGKVIREIGRALPVAKAANTKNAPDGENHAARMLDWAEKLSRSGRVPCNAVNRSGDGSG